jgi:lysozyme
MTRLLCQPAIDLIKRCEGFSATAYLCPAGVPTIGYGHTAGVLRADVGAQRITEAMGEGLLRDDLRLAQEAVERLVTVPLTDGEYGALVSFTFNCGAGNLQKSTLLRLLNLGKHQAAGLEFPKWNRGGGRVLPGLVARRKDEQILFFGGHDFGPQ